MDSLWRTWRVMYTAAPDSWRSYQSPLVKIQDKLVANELWTGANSGSVLCCFSPGVIAVNCNSPLVSECECVI